MKDNNPQTDFFSKKEVKETLLWTEKLVSKTGTRLTGSTGCKKAAKIIHQKFQDVCSSVEIQDFTHSRDAFLSLVKLMPISYVIALISIYFGGYWNYLAASCMIFVSFSAICEFMYYREFLDPFYSKTESRNIIGNIASKGKTRQTLIFSAHYDSPYVFHYLQNIQKYYIPILVITLFIYIFGLYLSISAMVFQIQSSDLFIYSSNWIIGMVAGLIFIIPYYFFITNEVSPGAGDNLIAVAILQRLAKYFSDPDNTLQNTELIFLITDAEESGLRGARAFVNKNREKLLASPHINYNMDSLFSVDHLMFLTSDINNTIKLSEDLANQSIQLAKKCGYTAGKMNIPFGGGGTDAGEFAKAGVKAVSLIAMDTTFKSGFNPYHTRDDHTKNIDPKAIQASLEIARSFACNLDKNNFMKKIYGN